MRESQDASVHVPRMRPKFCIEIPVDAEEAIARLREGFDTPELHGVSMVAGRHAELLVERAERRLWSPRLTVRLEDSPPGSKLRCRFSPRPDVWTGFMFVYFLLVFLVVFGATLGYVQQVSNETAWGFWAIPVGLTLIACIHLASYVGQRLAASQMRELRERLESVLTGRF
ncbi:MAG: hypothetical protein N2B05_01875, partial [Gemmatimonadales bacterium]